MANIERTLRKEIKRKNEKLKEGTEENLVKSAIIIIAVILLLTLSVVLISSKLLGDKKDNPVTESNYTEILAGQTFSKTGTYYVIFYEFGSDEDLSASINSLNINEKIYVVNLADKMNQGIMADKANAKVTKAEDLKITGATLIKIENGMRKSYIDGYDVVEAYLDSL